MATKRATFAEAAGWLRTAARDFLAEVMPQVRDELRVGRMVHRLEPDDALCQRPIVLLREPEEVELRLRRADDQDLRVRLERLRHLAKEAMLVVGMIPDPQILFVGVAMNVPARRVNERLPDLVRVDLEDARLLLIDPYDCVLHGSLLEECGSPVSIRMHEPSQTEPRLAEPLRSTCVGATTS